LFGPKAFVSPQPAHRLFQRRCCEVADDGAAGFGARDQGCVRQHGEMLHDRWQRYGKRACQVADGCAFPFAQMRQQRASRRIGERREDVVQAGGLTLNHIVNNTRPVRNPVKRCVEAARRAPIVGNASASGASADPVAWEVVRGQSDIASSIYRSHSPACAFLACSGSLASSCPVNLPCSCRLILSCSVKERRQVGATMLSMSPDA
jgi:hypothetical protein